MRKILIFGDSIAHGHNDLENGGWAGRLQNDLIESEITNFSLDGATTEDILRIIQSNKFERDNETTVIFAIGINDSALLRPRMTPWVALDVFRANIEYLLLEARYFATKIIFVGLTKVNERFTRPVEWDPDVHYDNDVIKRYNLIVSEVCSKNNVPFIEVFNEIRPETMEDGVHPGPVGHEIIEKLILAKLN